MPQLKGWGLSVITPLIGVKHWNFSQQYTIINTMKGLRFKSLGIVIPFSYTAFLIMFYINALYLAREAEALTRGLSVSLIIVTVLVTVICIILFRFLKPVDLMLTRIEKGEKLSQEERLKIRDNINKVPTVLIILNTVGFLVGPIASNIAINIIRNREFNLTNLTLLVLMNIGIGIVAALMEINIFNHISIKARDMLDIFHLDTSKKQTTYRIRSILVAFGSFFLMASIMLAASYGVYRDEIQRPYRIAEKQAAGIELTVEDQLYIEAARELLAGEPPENVKALVGAVPHAGGYFFLPIIILILILLFLVLFNQIASSNEHFAQLDLLTRKVRELSEGSVDLNARVNINRSNEIGFLTDSINLFIENLSSLLENVKAASKAVGESSRDLRHMVASSNETLTGAADQVARVKEAADNQNHIVVEADSKIEGIISSIQEITDKTMIQAESIERSSAAVTQMSANIASVNEIAVRAKNLAENLRTVASDGKSALSETLEAMSDIEQLSGEVRKIITVVSKVAAQTNMLAMNAAIEAAHAGDAGRGFAVVATEVRKLAEESSRSIKNIGGIIKEITGSIQRGAEVSTNTETAFSHITKDIEETSALIVTISGAMEEQNQAVADVLDSMIALSEVSKELQTVTGRQNADSADMKQAIQKVVEASQGILDITRLQYENNTALKEMLSSLNLVVDNNTQVVSKLSDIIIKFSAE